jgi:hypothetical protein
MGSTLIQNPEEEWRDPVCFRFSSAQQGSSSKTVSVTCSARIFPFSRRIFVLHQYGLEDGFLGHPFKPLFAEALYHSTTIGQVPVPTSTYGPVGESRHIPTENVQRICGHARGDRVY